MSLPGPSRHLAAKQHFGRFRSEVDTSRVHARRREITYDSSKNHKPPRSRSTERVASM